MRSAPHRRAFLAALLALGSTTCDDGVQDPEGSFQLSEGTVQFSVVPGGTSQQASVQVEAFQGTVHDLSVEIQYGSPPSQWLTATLDPTETTVGSPATLALQANASGFAVNAVDTAFVAISSPSVRNGGRVRVVLRVTPPPNRLVLATTPASTARSGDPLLQQPAIQLQTAEGTPLTAAGIGVQAEVESGGGSAQGLVSATTDAGGLASFSGLIVSGPIGPQVLRFSADGFEPVSSDAIDLQGGDAMRLDAVSSATQNGNPGCVVPSPPKVQVTDDGGNPVQGTPVTFEVNSGGGTVDPGSLPSEADGTASTVWTLGPVGSQTVEASADGLTGSPVTFTATAAVGQASQLGLSVAPSPSAASGSPFATQPEIQVQDACGTPLAQAVTVTAEIASGSGTLSGATSRQTDGTGLAQFTDLRITGLGAHTVTFEASGLASVTSGPISVGAGQVSAGQSSLSLSTGTITASTGSSTTTVTVTARDVIGMAIAGAAVVVLVDGLGNGAGGNNIASAAPTNAGGQTTVIVSRTVAGTEVVSAQINGTGIDQTQNLTITPASLDGTRSKVTASPGSITASGGSSTSTLSVLARDAFNNPINGAAVTLSSSGTENVFTSGLTTSGDGRATTAFSSIRAQSKAIDARITADGVERTVQTSLQVIAAAPNAAQSSLVAGQASIARVSGSTTVSVTVRDAFGNLVSGATVAYAATPASATFSPTSNSTATNGAASSSFSSTTAGDFVVSAQATKSGTTVAIPPTSIRVLMRFASDILPILRNPQTNRFGSPAQTSTCSDCHSTASQPPNLIDNPYGDMVNAATTLTNLTGCVGLDRVEPNQPDQSCLIRQLEHSAALPTPSWMPAQATNQQFLQSVIDQIRLWISQGAPNN